jgi:hypothetical protein
VIRTQVTQDNLSSGQTTADFSHVNRFIFAFCAHDNTGLLNLKVPQELWRAYHSTRPKNFKNAGRLLEIESAIPVRVMALSALSY